MKRSLDQEMMDLPGQPRELLEGNLGDIRAINHYLGNYRSVKRSLNHLLREHRLTRLSLLDVGTGSGDIPTVLARWARHKGVSASLVGLESEPVMIGMATHETRYFSEITFVRGDGYAPPFRPASFDFVLASQLLHHFPEDKIVTLLRTWSKLARKAIIISDLVRHPVAYHGIRLITQLFTRNVMTRTDAPLSVRRAFTIAEWRALFRRAEIGPFQIFSVFPFRVMALLSPAG